LALSVKFEHRYFRAIGGVADLVVTDHGGTRPARGNAESLVPDDNLAGFSRRKQAPHDEPSVGRLIAASNSINGAPSEVIPTRAVGSSGEGTM
jgi:hypothetical protein